MTIFIATLALMLGAYALCGVPFGYLISKRSAGVDVTHVGSGNIGSTNVARTVGAKAGAATLCLDALKGLVCVIVSRLVLALLITGGDTAPFDPMGPFGWCLSCVFLACVCGHIFSPYLGFKGGKGIACGFGAALGLNVWLALVILLVFLVVAVPTRYVSAGSIAGSVALPVAAVFLFWPSGLPGSWLIFWGFEIPLILAALCAIWAHRVNVRRLKDGVESEFSLKTEPDGTEEVVMDESRDLSDGEERRYDYTTDDVEAATIEAAEADAARRPQAGVTYTFGDERSVKSEVDTTERDVDELNEAVDDFEASLLGDGPRADANDDEA